MKVYLATQLLSNSVADAIDIWTKEFDDTVPNQGARDQEEEAN